MLPLIIPVLIIGAILIGKFLCDGDCLAPLVATIPVALIIGAFWISTYFTTTSLIFEFTKVQNLVNESKNKELDLLNITPISEEIEQKKTIDKQNKWLFKAQFWDKNIWTDWFYPDAIRDLKPIQ